MQDATWRDQVSLGNEEVNAKRIESLTATVYPCRFLQKINFMGPFSNPGPHSIFIEPGPLKIC